MDFHWNGDQLTEEIPVGVDGKPEDENAIRWIYEPRSFTPIALYKKGQLHYAVTDTVGRVQELLTEEGLIVWKGKQQLWGREEGINKEGAPTCRLRFPGQYEDTESGLYYNRFRYYGCETGQYISSDPIGLFGGVTPYSYVQNPLRFIDPFGLVPVCVQPGDKTPGGREFTVHGAQRTNERKFTSDIIDNIINNNKKNRVKEIDPKTGKTVWRYQDRRGNTVITDEYTERIVTVYSHPKSANNGVYIPK